MKENVEIVIQPNRNWLYIDWQGLKHYRDLMFLIVRRDFVSHYKQTVLGPLWFFIQPILMTVVFTVVFGNIAKISTDEIPPMLFYLCGLLSWRYFADSFNINALTFIANLHLFSKVYFPRLIMPLSIIISHLFSFGIHFITFIGFYVYFKFFTDAGSMIQPNWMVILLLPLVLFQVAAFSLGMGLWISTLTAKYRDLRFLMNFWTQLWMYATPVIYPMSLVPEKWRIYIAINPMAPVVEIFRFAFFGKGIIEPIYIVSSVVITIIILVTGVLIFNKIERTFIDTV